MREHNNNGAGWVTLSAKHVPTYLSHRQHTARRQNRKWVGGWNCWRQSQRARVFVYMAVWNVVVVGGHIIHIAVRIQGQKVVNRRCWQ